MKGVFTILFVFCLTLVWSAERADEQLWTDFYLTHRNDALEIQHRLGSRLSINNTANYLGHYRLRATLGAGLLKYRLGTALFYTHKNQIELYEIRPWGGLTFHIPINSVFQFRNYLRLENRFVANNISDFSNNPKGRLRYRFGMKSTLVSAEKSKISLVLLPELFVALGGYNRFNYNELRLISALNYSRNSAWVAGVKLIHQLPQYNAIKFDSDFTSILQLTIKRNL